ncbi:hypothetical protein BGW36DRAFT_380303 [Talaromyces proteolyticus]|uniref:Threonylcarbamoyl-AMP synthase n=1 Tax=Talaromyces proteolyticus TaxID=1131652 RepID=A0AAD4PZQ5_9EURO|nr:uncharacterized protein BGW36DRAFT_380303 [Talaromyces proteolyticus]KAH8696128.1 hypothetical protein BGW36DRAFT_380303 [Talaromyces proteolyticus]
MEPDSVTSHSRKPLIIPLPGELPDVKRDAAKAFAVLQAGGVIITPTDVGYGMMAASVEGIERAFTAKNRKVGHSLGIIGTYALHKKLHNLPPEKYNVTRTLSEEMGITIAVVAKMKEGTKELLPSVEKVTKNGTLGIAISEGPFQRELGRLNDENGQIMIGSSANLTGQGQKFQIKDIEPEVIEAADLIVDYGRQKWHLYGRAGTTIDLDNERVLRIGVNYEVIREKLIDWFGWSLPEDPEFSKEGLKRVGVSIKLDPDI